MAFRWENILLSPRLSKLCSGSDHQYLDTGPHLTLYLCSLTLDPFLLAPSLQETRDAAVLSLQSLEKQSREKRIHGHFQIPRFKDDIELCPVFALTCYYSK